MHEGALFLHESGEVFRDLDPVDRHPRGHDLVSAGVLEFDGGGDVFRGILIDEAFFLDVVHHRLKLIIARRGGRFGEAFE